MNLWQNHFALAELTDIMRQRDEEFAQVLNRLRKHKRTDAMLEHDISMLKQVKERTELVAIFMQPMRKSMITIGTGCTKHAQTLLPFMHKTLKGLLKLVDWKEYTAIMLMFPKHV